MHLNAKISASYLRARTALRPALGIVLGSGFQHALSEMRATIELPYGQIPGFPPVGVSGQAGKLVVGHFGHTPVIVLQGRAHYMAARKGAQWLDHLEVLAMADQQRDRIARFLSIFSEGYSKNQGR